MTDASTTGSDGVNADHWERNFVTRDLFFRHQGDLLILHQSKIETRASHVGYDQVRFVNRFS